MTLDRRRREALDRHITGNYGEDQFDHNAITVVVYFPTTQSYTLATNDVQTGTTTQEILNRVVASGAEIILDQE